MITVDFTNQTITSIDQRGVEKAVKEVLEKNGFNDTSVSVAVVHHNIVVDLAMQYMGESKQEALDHPVLSFLTSEVEKEFVEPPESNFLGEIVISLEKSEYRSHTHKVTLQEAIEYWADHAAHHLCGIHHD